MPKITGVYIEILYMYVHKHVRPDLLCTLVVHKSVYNTQTKHIHIQLLDVTQVIACHIYYSLCSTFYTHVIQE